MNDGIEFYYVYNAENGESFLVNAPNGEEAIKIIADEYNYDEDVLGYNFVVIPEGSSVNMENIVM